MFKVSSSPFGATLTVNPSGQISIPSYISGSWQSFQQINNDYGAYPANWENVFKSAETGKFNMTEWWNPRSRKCSNG